MHQLSDNHYDDPYLSGELNIREQLDASPLDSTSCSNKHRHPNILDNNYNIYQETPYSFNPESNLNMRFNNSYQSNETEKEPRNYPKNSAQHSLQENEYLSNPKAPPFAQSNRKPLQTINEDYDTNKKQSKETKEETSSEESKLQTVANAYEKAMKAVMEIGGRQLHSEIEDCTAQLEESIKGIKEENKENVSYKELNMMSKDYQCMDSLIEEEDKILSEAIRVSSDILVLMERSMKEAT